jgi:hypothetical protein
MMGRLGTKGAVFRAPTALGINDAALENLLLMEPLPDLIGATDQIHGPFRIFRNQGQRLIPGNTPVIIGRYFLCDIQDRRVEHAFPFPVPLTFNCSTLTITKGLIIEAAVGVN